MLPQAGTGERGQHLGMSSAEHAADLLPQLEAEREVKGEVKGEAGPMVGPPLLFILAWTVPRLGACQER